MAPAAVALHSIDTLLSSTCACLHSEWSPSGHISTSQPQELEIKRGGYSAACATVAQQTLGIVRGRAGPRSIQSDNKALSGTCCASPETKKQRHGALVSCGNLGNRINILAGFGTCAGCVCPHRKGWSCAELSHRLSIPASPDPSKTPTLRRWLCAWCMLQSVNCSPTSRNPPRPSRQQTCAHRQTAAAPPLRKSHEHEYSLAYMSSLPQHQPISPH